MNKISKKIVALVTMAAFVLTLVPAAAFAATADVEPTKSSVATVEKNVKVDINETVNYVLNLKDASGDALNDNNQVYVWVEDKEHNVVRNVTFYGNVDGQNPVTSANTAWIDNGRALLSNASADGRQMSLSLSEAGEYTIKAGVVKNAGTTPSSRTDLTTLENVKDYATINVAVPTTDSLEIRDQNRTVLQFDETDTAVLDLTNAGVRDGFEFNGSDVYTLTGVATDKDGNRLKDKTFTLSTSRSDVVEFAEDTVTTDSNGAFSIVFSMQSQKNSTITIANEEEGIDYTIRLLAATTSAQNIDRSVQNGYVLAGDDTHWTEDHRVFSDAVQFTITDEKGNAVTGPLTGEPAYTDENGNTGVDHNNYVRIMARPDDSDVTANDLGLFWDGSNYTLRYIGARADRVNDLVPGQYTVRVSLLSNDNATVTFNVDEFGTVKDTVLDITARDRSSQRVVDVDDEITLGQDVTVVGKYVDENGIKINATGLQIGAYGEAVKDSRVGNTFVFATKDDIAANESLLGTTITVFAQNSANKQLVSRELTVVKSYNAFKLEFDKNEGAVNEDNAVTVNVVKEDGSKAQVNGQLYAYIADQSNKDAKVSIDGNDTAVTNGTGHLSVYASEETTVDIVVAVKDNNNDGLYAATLEYTVGKADPLADRTVVMTIGSTEYVVNNNIIKGDAAPFVDSNWRTMVPIRALAEAFDAEVNWDNDARTVTINFDGATQIVMTVGETGYTVDGAEQTMDTEPVIQGDRTYVPIRFAAEALGFSVTPLYDSNNLTASVVFQR